MPCCHYYQLSTDQENIFSGDVSRLRYGPGVIRELGIEAKSFGLSRVGVFTDVRVGHIELFQEAIRSLEQSGLTPVVYDQTRVEPTNRSFQDAAAFAIDENLDGFISIGGGSVIDTCKAANLYSTYPADFLEYVNAPIGQGCPVPGTLRPHIACPTTAGTGSEATGIAVFDFLEIACKTGIASRTMLPDRAIVDPRWTETLPTSVLAATGFDAISHALEALTAKPYSDRRPTTHSLPRPMTQGANPFSDLFCREALRLAGENLVSAVTNPEDLGARHNMMYAATLAGIGFGNAGCHLPHAMSYPISGKIKDYQPSGYPDDQPICPHGVSVILNAPAAYRFTGVGCPERHLDGASLLGADTKNVPEIDAGEILASHIENMMRETGIPNGISGVGFDASDLSTLAEAASAQERLLAVSPRALKDGDLALLYQDALSYW
ncbi:hydroxyacid-oxoacid transhydrogenase [Arenicellales bacterium IMCC56312]